MTSSPSASSAPEAVPAHDPPGPLTALGVVRGLLRRHGLDADKGFGQNFLVDDAALRAIVAAAEVAPEDEVWEVGPGLGTLTRELARRARRVVAIELDARLLPVLDETLAPWPHVEVRAADALAVDYTAATPGSLFVANLPYHVGTAILTRVLAAGRFRRVVVLVQREVGDRLTATAGTPAYGSLSLWVAHHGRARSVRHVPPGAFFPPPTVTSSIVRIELDPAAQPDPRTFALVRDAFRHRRKTLVANLRAVGVAAERTRAALAGLGLDPRVRAEALDLASFRALARDLADVLPNAPTERAVPDLADGA
jgi:16S rRNA (adenine1518-N6/adenine1519-N6)-dimethyltransferase